MILYDAMVDGGLHCNCLLFNKLTQIVNLTKTPRIQTFTVLYAGLIMFTLARDVNLQIMTSPNIVYLNTLYNKCFTVPSMDDGIFQHLLDSENLLKIRADEIRDKKGIIEGYKKEVVSLREALEAAEGQLEGAASELSQVHNPSFLLISPS